MSEFGHKSFIGNGVCIDSWGAGPFVIEADERRRLENEEMQKHFREHPHG